MPWEHAIVGYIGYSILVRVLYRDRPTTRETIVVLFASILPDLIDKPLAWQFNIFPSGYAIGHSIFFAVPVSVVVFSLVRRRGKERLGIAFGVGYLLHLPADVFPQYIRQGTLPTYRVLWPLRQQGSGYEGGFAGEFRENFSSYLGWISEQIASGNPDPYLFVLLGVAGLGLLLWIADGMPIGREIYDAFRRVLKKAE